MKLGFRGEVWISGTGRTENKVSYPPEEHDGWLVVHYADADPYRSNGVTLHEGETGDLSADNDAVVAAITACMNTADETGAPLYVTLHQLPDRRVHAVAVSAERPALEELWSSTVRHTVWAAYPQSGAASVTASPVWNPGLTEFYRDDDRNEWAKWTRTQREFHGDSDERRRLRAVEAWLIQAGHIDAHTGLVAAQTYGLTIESAGHEYSALQNTAGAWLINVDFLDYWDPEPLAPANASPRQVAAAILARIHDGDSRRDLHRAARIYLAVSDPTRSARRTAARWWARVRPSR
ncbi:hypothetical protein [Streptomyces sp. NBC_00401]|uniref:hypothetical protein n=1 Tax=Streptomyces sp. NBC_00401 TaxID=2975738 RepID=UPI002255A92B|nr:hypothetical protein [Streptomyces sp. NBC_00401]MCX5083697.1 hypothetical protein [Streptomyces sp. NBC_00401]